MLYWSSHSFIFSFLEKQSSSFREAFLGPITYTETLRAKRDVDPRETNEELQDNELDLLEGKEVRELVSLSLKEENQLNVRRNENVSLSPSKDEDEEAINCNWNIKVRNSTISLCYHVYV